jgi:hypothetical protein
VVILQGISHAAPAFIAVKSVLSASNPAYSALFTMENLLSLVVIVKKNTDAAEIASKGDPTSLTALLRALHMLTLEALDLFGGKSIELMRLFDVRLVQVFGIIVTEAAREELLALRAPLQTGPSVVRAAGLHLRRGRLTLLGLFLLFFDRFLLN